MGNKAFILESFVKEIDSRYDVSPNWYVFGFDEYYSQVLNFIKEVYGQEEATKLSGLLDKYDDKKSIGTIKGYLLGLIAKSDDSVSSNKRERIPEPVIPDIQSGTKVVFLVHGHDSESKETTARFVEKLGPKVVILHEQPDGGKTIIEKFESFANSAAYAIILLTPDDLGASKSNAKTPKYRARQNVIYELGFFVGKLGRERAVALCKGDIELPSDYHGVLYIPMDAEGAWKLKLAQEMKTAGLSINLDKVI